jgi:hypothetical protein
MLVLNAAFSNISAKSWRQVLVVEEAGDPERTTDTGKKQPVNFITCSCESNAPFFVIFCSSSIYDFKLFLSYVIS